MHSLNGEKIRLIGDYHTHTVYSSGGLYHHGKGTVFENAMQAKLLGIREIAITDHGPAQRFYGMKISEMKRCRNDINEAEKLISGIKIYLSVEANIVDTKSGIDIEEEQKGIFDYISAGYHHGCKNSRTISNIVSYSRCMPSGSYERLRTYNTDTVVRALTKNDIKVLTHPLDKGPFNVKEVFKACEASGTLVEINNRHDNLSADDIYEIAKFDIRFIVSSDAHKPSEVGKCDKAIAKLIKSGIDISRIVNLEKEETNWK